MEVSQPNNATSDPDIARRFGIRVTAPPGDFLMRLVGPGWETFHWFATREERDAALRDMGARHRYSRSSDAPSIVLEPVER